MAAVPAPVQVAAKHQSRLHFVRNAPWSDAAIAGQGRRAGAPGRRARRQIEAWIIDETELPKKAQHSVG
jgi:SRSO17 transposase